MAAAKKNTELNAVNKIVEAVTGLDESIQDRVIASALTLLGKTPLDRGTAPKNPRDNAGDAQLDRRDDGQIVRPKGLTELVREKQPGTNSQRIALFAYYREKYEQNARFGREDLKAYFSKAHLIEPANYDRDFSKAADQGWIHEGGDQSYITTSGMEVVERGFQGERAYVRANRKRKALAKRGVRRPAPKKK